MAKEAPNPDVLEKYRRKLIAQLANYGYKDDHDDEKENPTPATRTEPWLGVPHQRWLAMLGDAGDQRNRALKMIGIDPASPEGQVIVRDVNSVVQAAGDYWDRVTRTLYKHIADERAGVYKRGEHGEVRTATPGTDEQCW